MTTPERAWENAWQAHLRSARYWEVREGRPPVPEAELRRQFEEVGHRAWRIAEFNRAHLSPDASRHGDLIEVVVEKIGEEVARRLQEAPPVRHIHHHGPALPIVRAKQAPHQEPGTVRLPE